MQFTKTRKRITRTLWLVVSFLLVGFSLFYWWQPWEFDIVHRGAPVLRVVDPEATQLFSSGTRVMIVTAHPDDPEFYIGGLLSRLFQSGANLTLVVVTDGDKGYYPFSDAESTGKVRRAEQRAASRAWGCNDVRFLGFPDGRLKTSKLLSNSLLREVESVSPQYLFTFDPLYRRRVSHADHRRTAEALDDALSKYQKPVWKMFFDTDAPNWCFDITERWETKLRLLSFHKSQFGQSGSSSSRAYTLLKSFAEKYGLRAGVSLAEGFRCIKFEPSN